MNQETEERYNVHMIKGISFLIIIRPRKVYVVLVIKMCLITMIIICCARMKGKLNKNNQ